MPAPGGAVLRVLVEAGTTDDGVTPCEDADLRAAAAHRGHHRDRDQHDRERPARRHARP